MYLVILIKFYCVVAPTFIYVICLQWSDIVADSISLTTYKIVLLSIGNKLRNGYNTTLKPHPATPTSWPDHFESGGATPEYVTLTLANGCNPTTSFAQAFQHALTIFTVVIMNNCQQDAKSSYFLPWGGGGV